MNRLLIIPLALLAAAVHAQSLTYVDMAEVSGTDLVRVVKIEDLSALIKNHKVKSVLRSQDQFVIQVGSVLYAMESSGFKTIQDYRDGKETFGSGDLYYVARKQALATKAEVEYFNGELFITGDDYRAARKAGFCDKAATVKPRGVTGLITKADLQRNLHAAASLLAIKASSGDEQRNADDILAIKDLPVLAKSSFGAIRAVDEDTYYVSITTDWLAVAGTGNASPGKANAPATQPGPDPKRSDAAGSDAVFYYLSRLGLYPTFAEAVSAVKAAVPSGAVLTIVGTNDLLKKTGFKNLAQVPPAIDRGFSDGVTYGLAMEYNLADRAEYGTYERRIADYEKLKSKYGLKTRGEAEVAAVLLDLQKRLPVSFGRFAEQFNKGVAEDPLIKRSGFRIDESTVASLLGRSPKLADQFVYDKDGKSLYRK
jgi:hypothetical protein